MLTGDAHLVNYYPNPGFRKHIKAHNRSLFVCTYKHAWSDSGFVSLLLGEEDQERDQHVETASGLITVVFANLAKVN